MKWKSGEEIQLNDEGMIQIDLGQSEMTRLMAKVESISTDHITFKLGVLSLWVNIKTPKTEVEILEKITVPEEL